MSKRWHCQSNYPSKKSHKLIEKPYFMKGFHDILEQIKGPKKNKEFYE